MAKSESVPQFHHESGARARRQAGRDRRATVPLAAHADMPRRRRDPLGLLAEQDEDRIRALVPIRHGRLAATPFNFYRGGAAIMGSDLSETPTTDIRVQLCGDAHLSNFGMFHGPDRRLVFDIYDFDETIPGPFEWDVKRLAASVTIAGRERGFKAKEIRHATLECVTSYREMMATAAGFSPLDVFYFRIEVEAMMASLDARMRKRAMKASSRAVRKNSVTAVSKLAQIVDGRHQIVPHPPLVTRIDGLVEREGHTEVIAFFHSYLSTLPLHRRHVLNRYAVVDVAHKVVGVGSVGTRCVIVLLESGDGHPLFLQFKEAMPSVLERYCGASTCGQHGQRIVEGTRGMQTMGDIFLGWSQLHGEGRTTDFYFRQLWDGKGSFESVEIEPAGLASYARSCGSALALGHARTGDASVISGYLGTSDTFDQAVTEFASGYADINEADHRAHAAAIRAGRIEAISDI
jgi:uncharacterized protein (DUF2252 family)